MNGGLDLAAIRARHPLPDVAAASIKLHRSGGEWNACCPFHPDRNPSFTIYDGGTRWCCFVCDPRGGDVLDYVKKLHQVTLLEAVRMLEGNSLPAIVQPPLPSEPDRDTTAEAIRIWNSAKPAAGTRAQAYLHSRGLTGPIPESIRFAILPYGRGAELPCLIALITNEADRAVGIHRIFLRPDGVGKADVRKPKLSLGRVSGCAVRLAPAGREVIVAEGIEDALTMQQELGISAWAAAGAGMLRRLRLPRSVASVIIGADGDAPGEAAATEVAERFASEGRTVRIIRPMPGFKDFNAELQGACS